jgi:ribosomal protein S27AE
MGIKCSLLGHRFEETEVERDRDEQGSEVVITIREIETCTRCGESRIVSENKEVTSVEQPENVAVDVPEGDAEDAGDAGACGPPNDDAAGATGGSDGPSIIEEAEAEMSTGPADGEEATPTTDDAVILDADGDEETGRTPGEWPEEPAPEEQGPPSGWPEESTDDRESGVDPSGDAPADDATDPTDDWPDDPREDDPADDLDWEPSGPDADRRSGSVGDGPTAVTVPEGTFYCPECSFTTPVGSSSLREGDFCPECHRGTLLVGDGTRKE